MTALANGGCAEYTQTTRLVAGRQHVGRPIEASAYAAYLKGIRHELRGERERALAEYQLALDYDSESVELRTRLGWLTCQEDYIRSTKEFQQAQQLDPEYAPAWIMGARCALEHNDDGPALTWARQAVAVAPLEFSASEVLIETLLAHEEVSEAERVLLGYLTRFPEDLRAQRMLLVLPPQRQPPAWRAAALSWQARSAQIQLQQERRRRRLQNGGGLLPPALSPESPTAEERQSALREAVSTGSLPEVRALGLDAELSAINLAWQTLDWGRPDITAAQASLVLAADPENGDARVLLWLAAERLGEPLLASPVAESQRSRALSPRARRELTALLSRQLGLAELPPPVAE